MISMTHQALAQGHKHLAFFILGFPFGLEDKSLKSQVHSSKFSAHSLMYHLKSPPNSNCTWDALSFEQCLFNKRLPNRLKTFSGLWSFLRA
jgi:hypothetical protein